MDVLDARKLGRFALAPVEHRDLVATVDRTLDRGAAHERRAADQQQLHAIRSSPATMSPAFITSRGDNKAPMSSRGLPS